MTDKHPAPQPDNWRSLQARTEARRDREVGSVANAMRLIDELGRHDEAGVSELARLLGLSKPSVDRLLSTLVHSGFVEQNSDTKKYRLGIKFVAIADSVRPRTALIAIARPHLTALAERFRETVNLGTLAGGSVVYADSIPSQQLFRIESKPGSMLPAYCTAMGKAILAFRPEWELEAYLRETTFTALTPYTTASAAALRERVAEARARGYAIDGGEILEEACCVGAPIMGGDGMASAALSITAPRSTFLRRQEEFVAAVVETAARVAADAATVSGARAAGS